MIFLVLFFSLLSFCNLGWPGDPSHVLKMLQERYTGIVEMGYRKITITKTGTVLGNLRDEVAEGRLYFMAPDKIRMEQRSPQKELLISNGSKVWWHVFPKNEVYVYHLKDMGLELTLLLDMFQGMRNNSEQVDIIMKEEGKVKELKIIPKANPSSFEAILLKVTEDSKIALMEIQNLAGGKTILEFPEDPRPAMVGQEIFEYQIPEDVKIIE